MLNGGPERNQRLDPAHAAMLVGALRILLACRGDVNGLFTVPGLLKPLLNTISTHFRTDIGLLVVQEEREA